MVKKTVFSHKSLKIFEVPVLFPKYYFLIRSLCYLTQWTCLVPLYFHLKSPSTLSFTCITNLSTCRRHISTDIPRLVPLPSPYEVQTDMGAIAWRNK